MSMEVPVASASAGSQVLDDKGARASSRKGLADAFHAAFQRFSAKSTAPSTPNINSAQAGSLPQGVASSSPACSTAAPSAADTAAASEQRSSLIGHEKRDSLTAGIFTVDEILRDSQKEAERPFSEQRNGVVTIEDGHHVVTVDGWKRALRALWARGSPIVVHTAYFPPGVDAQIFKDPHLKVSSVRKYTLPAGEYPMTAAAPAQIFDVYSREKILSRNAQLPAAFRVTLPMDYGLAESPLEEGGKSLTRDLSRSIRL